jgi:hypothetical protein
MVQSTGRQAGEKTLPDCLQQKIYKQIIRFSSSSNDQILGITHAEMLSNSMKHKLNNINKSLDDTPSDRKKYTKNLSIYPSKMTTLQEQVKSNLSSYYDTLWPIS